MRGSLVSRLKLEWQHICSQSDVGNLSLLLVLSHRDAAGDRNGETQIFWFLFLTRQITKSLVHTIFSLNVHNQKSIKTENKMHRKKWCGVVHLRTTAF